MRGIRAKQFRERAESMTIGEKAQGQIQRGRVQGSYGGGGEMKNKIKRPVGRFNLELPNVGLGTMRTSATYIALLLQFERNRGTRLDVIQSVMDILGLHLEELIHFKKCPPVRDEKEYIDWYQEWIELKNKLGVDK